MMLLLRDHGYNAVGGSWCGFNGFQWKCVAADRSMGGRSFDGGH
jgi:hypothetical protein